MLVLFLLLGLVRGLWYLAVIPPWQGPDEPPNFEYVRLVYETRRWVTPEDASPELQRQVTQSLCGLDFPQIPVRSCADPSNWPTFQDLWGAYGLGSRLGAAPLYHALAAAFQTLASTNLLGQMYLARLASALLGVATLGVAFFALREAFPGDPALRTATMTFLTFLPMYSYMRVMINSDSLAALFGAAVIFWLARFLRQGELWPAWVMALALTLLGLFAKKTTFYLLPLTLAAIPLGLAGRVEAQRRWRGVLRGTLVAGGTLMFAAGSLALFARPTLSDWAGGLWNLVNQYESPGMLANTFTGLLSRNPLGPQALELYPLYARTLFNGFWGVYGWWTIHLPESWYQGVGAISLLSVVGIAYSVYRPRRRLSEQARRVLWLMILAALLAILVAYAHSYARFFSTTFGRPQGRYLFSALVPFASLFVLGLLRLTPPRFQRVLPVALLIGLVVFDGLTLALVVLPRSYPGAVSLVSVLERITAGKPGVLGAAPFHVLLGILYILLLAGLIGSQITSRAQSNLESDSRPRIRLESS